MILVDNYILAILCCVYCCLCWGSWANTQKMVTSKSWSFELFYWDLAFGLFFTALLGALTLGSLGSEGRTFFEDLAAMDWNSMKYALLGGIVWNFGNIFLTAAIAVAGMSIGFPIGGGLAWIGGIIFNYLLITLAGEVYPGNQALLWIGVVVIIVAICICGKAYGKMSASQASTPKKGILLAIVAGLAIMFFLWIGCKITRSPVCCGWYGNTDSLYRRILLCRRCPYHYSHFQYVCHESSGSRKQGHNEGLSER